MTAKLILSLDGVFIQEYPLSKDRMTIGRKPDNDIVINNLAVSSQHAAIITIGHDSFMEDLDSTNGLSVNGVPVKKHFLQNNDVIEIGKYTLKYMNEYVSKTSAADFEKTMILRAPVAPLKVQAEKSGDTGLFQKSHADSEVKTEEQPESPPQVDAVPVQAAAPRPVTLAAIQILNGPNAGKELDLVKGLTTLGKPGVQVAVLTRRPQGFFITHVEGANFPSVNGQVLGGQPRQLQDHDLIELAGIKMEFYFKN
ncbi:MAG: FHA domain-containing protein [Gallionella sp.]|jgi:pSer/pThr/pTyr-binding forkhead associated (FHA) protein